MATPRLSEKDLHRELGEYRDRYPKLGDDELFVLWFLRAFVTESESDAAAALCGGPSDKGIDAVLIDDPARIVFVAQGKYRKEIAAKTEHRADVTGFAQLAVQVRRDSKALASLPTDLPPAAGAERQEARTRVA